MELPTSQGALESTRRTLQHLQALRDASHARLARSSDACNRSWEQRSACANGQPHSESPDVARERAARERLLEWEAQDLSRVVLEEMGTDRRRFAMRLYETAAMAQSLGMTDERLMYHVRYALREYRDTASSS